MTQKILQFQGFNNFHHHDQIYTIISIGQRRVSEEHPTLPNQPGQSLCPLRAPIEKGSGPDFSLKFCSMGIEAIRM
jgi:hypothetical protein